MFHFQHARVYLHKLYRQAPIVFFVFLLFATSLSAVLSSQSYDFVITNRVIWFALCLSLQITLATVCFLKRNELSKLSIAISQLLPILAFAYYYFIDSLIYMVSSGIVAIHAFLFFIPCYAISLFQMQFRVLRVISAIFNTILLFAFLALFYLAVTFGSLGEKEIIRETISPGGSYMATQVSIDSGALGGAMNVIVEELPSSVNVGFGRFAKLRQVYSRDWSTHNTFVIEWKDDQTLLINGKVYIMPNESSKLRSQ